MKYLLLYKGPQTPPGASHAGWPEWFASIGPALVNRGSALKEGKTIRPGTTLQPSQLSIHGYSIVEAADTAVLARLLATHPYLALGTDYSIEVFET